jgi:regulator of protease activity HflC (stomatin/prohibitin superfamily)
MKKTASLLLVLSLFALGCDLIKPGEAGIVVQMIGGEENQKKGVTGGYDVITAQRVWVGPREKLYKMPVTLQSYVWTKDLEEQSALNEEITFDIKEGSSVRADVAMAFYVDHTKVGSLFNKYGKPMKEILATEMRNRIRVAYNSVTTKMTIEDVLVHKSEISKQVLQKLQEDLGPEGFRFMYIGFVSALRYPQDVQTKMDGVVGQKIRIQKSIIGNGLASAKAENDILASQGDAEVKKVLAEAEKYEIATLGTARNKAAEMKVKLLGPDNYSLIEQMDTFVAALAGSPESFRLSIVPADAMVVRDSTGSNKVIIGGGK